VPRDYKKLYNIELTITELEHLDQLIMNRRRDGWYYGNQKQYEDREHRIYKKLNKHIPIIKEDD